MGRKVVTEFVCDGCGKPYEEDSQGTARVSAIVVGETTKVTDTAEDGTKTERDAEARRVIDLCADCTGKLPAGAVKAKSGRKTENGSENGAEPAAAETPEPAPTAKK